MKKNKILFLILALVLLSTVGCNARQMRLDRTQTRLGVERPNNMTRRNDLGDPNMGPDNVNRNRNFDTNLNNNLDPNTRPELRGRNNLSNQNLRTEIGRNATDIDFLARSSYIARKVEDFNEVDEASVLITGDTALVGVKTKDNVKGEITTDLKQKIENKVKNTDNRIKNVAVTASPDIATRIRDMTFDIERGRPLSGFAVEIKEILRRITPIK